MTENWMIDVLADLRKFAKNNKMGELAEQLGSDARGGRILCSHERF